MKNHTIFITFFITANIFAQELYFKLNGSYGLTFSSNLYKSQEIDYNSVEPRYFIKNVPVSLGEGNYIGGSVGYIINKFLGLELNISYLMKSKEFSYSSDYIYRLSEYGEPNYYRSENRLSGRMLQFIPSFFFYTKLNSFKPYLRCGIILGIGDIKDKALYNGTYEKVYKYNGYLAVGLNTSIGVFYDLTRRFLIFMEISANNISYAPSKGKLENARINGEEQAISNNDDFKFVNQFYSNSPQTLKTNYLFSSINISIGVKYTIYRKE
jgi:hypothetical protein